MRWALAALASLSVVAWTSLPSQAATAIVRGLHAIPSAASTRIVIEVEGAFRYRTQPSDDGKSMLVDIENATLGESTPRILPVSDRRIDGVIVLADSAARIVRISVDVAGRVAPRLEAGVESSRLILNFLDASSGSAPKPSSAPPGVAAPAVPAAGKARPIDNARTRTATRTANESAGKPAARTASESARTAAKTRESSGKAASTTAATTTADSTVRETTARRDRATAGTAAAASSPAAQKSIVQKPVVVLDPGHGGKDPGARAWTGEYEKDIVLDLAERVARRLRKRGDVEVVMTRSGDEFITLADRRDTSRRWNADAFVSIHANASHSAAARGIETYYYNRKTGGSAAASDDRLTRRLARVENGRPARSGSKAAVSPVSLSSASPPVLDRRAESVRLASLVQGELVRQLGMRYEAVRDLGAKEGPFFVIGHNAAPSVLVEAAFLTHREEGLRMRSEVYREQIADGVARGIVAFLEQQRRSGAL